MSAPHVTSEQLALLAMDAELDDSVRAHVANCPACTKDLSVIRSLLNADGPDSEAQREGVTRDPAPEPALPPEAFTAMADAADGRPEPAEPEPAPQSVNADAADMGHASSSSGRHVLALVAAIIVAAALIVAAAVLWR